MTVDTFIHVYGIISTFIYTIYSSWKLESSRSLIWRIISNIVYTLFINASTTEHLVDRKFEFNAWILAIRQER